MPKAPSNVINIQDEECLHGLGNDFYYISQILKQRTLSNGRVQIFVSWEGWPETYNSWVYKDTMMPADIFKSVDSTSIFTQESSKSKSKNNRNKQVKQELKVKHEDKKIQSKQVVPIQSIQVSQLGNSGNFARKSRRKRHDEIIEGREKELQINVENKDNENGSKNLRKKKEQVKSKIDKNAVKAKKRLDKVRNYTPSDPYSQNQISETRRKFAINFQKKTSDATHQTKDAQKLDFISLPTTQHVVSSRTPHEQDGSCPNSKQILNKKSKEDKNDSLLINIGDISDVDLSKISLQSEGSFLCSGQSSSNKIFKQRKQKKYVDKLCPWKRFKIDPNQNNSEKIKKVDLMQSQNCIAQNCGLSNKQLAKKKEKEEKKQVEQKRYCKQEQNGNLPVIKGKQMSFNEKKLDEKSKMIQITNNNKVSKKKLEEYKEIRFKNGNMTISPDSLLIDNLNLTDPTCQPKNCELNSVSNLLSNLQATRLQQSAAEIGLIASNLFKNNQTSLLIDSSFCKNLPSKLLKDTTPNDSFSLLIGNTSNQTNNDERKTMRVTKKEQQIQEEPTSIEEQANKRNKSATGQQQNKNDQFMDKYDTPLLPDEQQQKIQYEGVYEDEAKNKIHRSNKAIDFYFRRQYPELFNQSCQQTNNFQIQQTFDKQDQVIDLDGQFDPRAQRQKKQNLKFDRALGKQEQNTSKDNRKKKQTRKSSHRGQKKVKDGQKRAKEEENKQTKIEQQQQYEQNEQLKSMLQQQNTIIFCEPAVNSDVYEEQPKSEAAQNNKSRSTKMKMKMKTQK